MAFFSSLQEFLKGSKLPGIFMRWRCFLMLYKNTYHAQKYTYHVIFYKNNSWFCLTGASAISYISGHSERFWPKTLCILYMLNYSRWKHHIILDRKAHLQLYCKDYKTQKQQATNPHEQIKSENAGSPNYELWSPTEWQGGVWGLGRAVALFQASGPWSGMLGLGKKAPTSPSAPLQPEGGITLPYGVWSSQQAEQDSSFSQAPATQQQLND